MLNISAKQKSILGNLIFQLILWLIPFHLYLVYRAIKTRNRYLIAYLSFIQFWGYFCKRNPAFIKFTLWFKIQDIFNETKLILEEPVPNNNCLFAFHPHGIMCLGLMSNMNQPGTIFADVIGLSSRVALNTPFCSLMLKLWGVDSVSAYNLKRLLQAGTNCALVPGGFEEATLSTKKENRIFLKNRKGFIKYALQYGTSVYPVFTFGENLMYNTVDKCMNLRLFLNRLKIVGTIFWSRFGTQPETDISLITVVGKGVKCPKIDKPTSEDVDKYHEIYMKSIIALYEKYQPQYAPNMKLRVY